MHYSVTPWRADRSTQLVIGADIAIRDPPGMAPDRLLARWSCQPIIRLLARDRVIRATRRESNRRHPPPPPSRSTDRRMHRANISHVFKFRERRKRRETCVRSTSAVNHSEERTPYHSTTGSFTQRHTHFLKATNERLPGV